jgi:flagellar motor switch protein FliM
MDNPLNQYEIEALLRLAHAGEAAAPEKQRTVEPYRFERSGQFGAEQAGVVSGVQEALAKGITQSLGAYLRTSFETTLASVEQMTFREAVEHVPPETYLLSLQFQSGAGIIQIDQSLVFPLIDILLGGTGQGPMVNREVTEIEDHVMEGVGKIVCHEIAAAWGVDAGNCDLVGAQRLPQIQRLLPANDRVVVSKFESKMGETSGQLQVLIPAITFNALLRKLSSDVGGGNAAAPSPSGAKLAQKMMDCLFPVSLALSAIQLPVEKVLELRPEQVCDLGVPLNRSASFIVAGRETFDGIPVRQGQKRAAQIGQQKKQSAQEKRGQS